MAIKRQMMLCSTEIADSPFRSLQDVDKLLKLIKQRMDDAESLLRQYQTQFSRSETTAAMEFLINKDPGAGKKKPAITVDKVDKFVVPKLDQLRNNFAIADQLSDQVDSLETLYSTISVNFRGVRGQPDTLKNIRAMQKSAEAKLAAALKFLNTIGSKYAPTQFKEMVDEAMKGISTELEYSNHKTFLYAHETTDGSMTFTYYVQLLNLMEDDGEQYPEFYIVFTCVLSPMSGDKKSLGVEYFVTVMQHFQTPGKFNPGRKVVGPQEAIATVGTLMALENISTSIGTIPHNLNPVHMNKDRFRAGSRVATIEVEPNALTFAFLKNVKKDEAKQLANSLYVDVKGMLTKSLKDKAQLKVKFGPVDGRFYVKFILVNPAADGQVSVNDLEFLKNQFNLDDNKMRNLVRVING